MYSLIIEMVWTFRFNSGHARLSLGSWCVSFFTCGCCLANMVFISLLGFYLISLSIEFASTAHSSSILPFSLAWRISPRKGHPAWSHLFCCPGISMDERGGVEAGRKGRAEKYYSIFSFFSVRNHLGGSWGTRIGSSVLENSLSCFGNSKLKELLRLWEMY